MTTSMRTTMQVLFHSLLKYVVKDAPRSPQNSIVLRLNNLNAGSWVTLQSHPHATHGSSAETYFRMSFPSGPILPFPSSSTSSKLSHTFIKTRNCSFDSGCFFRRANVRMVCTPLEISRPLTSRFSTILRTSSVSKERASAGTRSSACRQRVRRVLMSGGLNLRERWMRDLIAGSKPFSGSC